MRLIIKTFINRISLYRIRLRILTDHFYLTLALLLILTIAFGYINHELIIGYGNVLYLNSLFTYPNNIISSLVPFNYIQY